MKVPKDNLSHYCDADVHTSGNRLMMMTRLGLIVAVANNQSRGASDIMSLIKSAFTSRWSMRRLF